LNSFFVSSVVALFLTLALCLFVLIQKPKKRLHLVYGSFLFALSFWIFGDIFYFTDLPLMAPASLWVTVANLGALFCPPLWLHFIFLLVQIEAPFLVYLFLYGISGFLQYLNITSSPLLFRSIEFLGTGNLKIVTGTAYLIFIVYLFAALIIGFGIALYYLRRSRGVLRMQLQYYIFATLIVIAATAVYSFSMETSSSSIRLDNLFLVVYTGLIAYSITKHDLMDISVVITRNTATIISMLLACGNIAVVFVLLETPLLLFLGTSLSVLFWSFYFMPLRLFLQTTLEKKFLKGRYDYVLVLKELVDDLAKCSDISGLIRSLNKTFMIEMEIDHIQVFFPEFYDTTFRTSGVFCLWKSSDKSTKVRLTHLQSHILSTAASSVDILSLHADCDEDIKLEMMGLGVQSAIPCFLDNTLVCLVLIGHKLSEEPFSKDDLTLFATVSSQISGVLDRIRRSRAAAELDLAQQIQLDILPKNPSVPGLEISCFMKQADEVGGDYYDVIVLPETSWILLGDVTGHGLGSGLVMFMVQSILTSILQTHDHIEPKFLTYQANTILYDNLQRLKEQLPMTFAAIRFDREQQFTICGCHDSFFIYRAAERRIEILELNHFPFGIGFSRDFSESDFTQISSSLAKDDVLYMVTDGITEAFHSGNAHGEQFGEERLLSFISGHSHLSADEIKDALVKELQVFTRDIYHDDVTFIIVKSVS
jgi:serine phosphatase RsbU (regulator of sigma subunit)